MIQNMFFQIGLALLLVHEMDAVRLQEWRMIPVLSKLDERVAQTVFIALHAPLYLGLFTVIQAPSDMPVVQTAVIALDGFFLIHLGLHLAYLRHPQNQFRSTFSWSLIAGAAIAGSADLAQRALPAG